MKATSALWVLPFESSVELTREHGNGTCCHWKALAEQDALVILTWGEHGRLRHVIPREQCLDEDPVQEMWRRATEKIEHQQYRWVNGQ